ncbi:hypothetical protein HDZ31DRAFT_41879 [Schizophyllum fasciatum]
MAPIISSFEHRRQSQRRGAHHLPRTVHNYLDPGHAEGLELRSPASDAQPSTFAHHLPGPRIQEMAVPPFFDTLVQPVQLTSIGIALIALVSSLTIAVAAGLLWKRSPWIRGLAHDTRISITLVARRLVRTSNSTVPSSSPAPKSILKPSVILAPTMASAPDATPAVPLPDRRKSTPTDEARITTIRWADQEKDISTERVVEGPFSDSVAHVIRASESDHSMLYASDSNLYDLLTQAGIQSIKRRAWAVNEDPSSNSPFADTRQVSPSTSNESSVSGTFSSASGYSSFTSIDSASSAGSDTESVASADVYEVHRVQTRSIEVKRGVLVNWRLSSGPDLAAIVSPGKGAVKQDLFAPALIVTGPSSETLSTITTSSSLDLTDFPVPPTMISSALDGLMETIYSSEESDDAEESSDHEGDDGTSKSDPLKRSTVDQFIMLYGQV